jgi:hypothetical protein
VVLELADQHVQDAVLARVAPHVPLVLALGVHFVKGAVRTLVVKRRVAQHLVVLQRVVQVRSLSLACCLRLRLLALQRSALAQHPCRERPWSLAR